MSWDRRCGQMDEPKQMSHKKNIYTLFFLVVEDKVRNWVHSGAFLHTATFSCGFDMARFHSRQLYYEIIYRHLEATKYLNFNLIGNSKYYHLNV